MKVLLFLMLIAIPVGLFAQKPPRGAYKIIVRNSKSKDENFLKVYQILLTNGYLIDTKDKERYIIESAKKRLEEENYNYWFNFEIEDSAIIVTGKLADSYMPRTLSKTVYWLIENKGSNGCALRETFDEMLFLSKRLGHDIFFESNDKKKNKDQYLEDDYYNRLIIGDL